MTVFRGVLIRTILLFTPPLLSAKGCRKMRRHSLLLAVAILLTGLSSAVVRADSVTLTSGTVSTLSGFGTVNLLGNNFSLIYTGEIPPGAMTAFTINSVTLAIGLPNVSFNGVDTRFFNGALSFNNSLLSGNLTAYATMEDLFFNRSPLFTVTFSANGFMTVTQLPGGGTDTRFTVATPEPATVILLGAGLFGEVAFKRGRGKRLEPINSSDPADL